MLRFAHRQAPQAAMQLQASDEADYGRFAQVLAAGRNAGFTDIAFPR